MKREALKKGLIYLLTPIILSGCTTIRTTKNYDDLMGSGVIGTSLGHKAVGAAKDKRNIERRMREGMPLSDALRPDAGEDAVKIQQYSPGSNYQHFKINPRTGELFKARVGPGGLQYDPTTGELLKGAYVDRNSIRNSYRNPQRR